MDKTIRNSFEHGLIDNGYKIFKDSLRNSIRGFQKRYDDEHGKKYFINFYHYNHGEQIGGYAPFEDTYYAEVQFEYDNHIMNIGIGGNFTESEITLPEVEKKIEDLFLFTNANYYEKYE